MKSGQRQGVKKMKGGKSLLTTWLQSPTKKMSVMSVGDSQAVDGAKAKEVPGLEAGFLVQVGSGVRLIRTCLSMLFTCLTLKHIYTNLHCIWFKHLRYHQKQWQTCILYVFILLVQSW